jgi:hypothetical protein
MKRKLQKERSMKQQVSFSRLSIFHKHIDKFYIKIFKKLSNMSRAAKKTPDWKLCEIANTIEYQAKGCITAPSGRSSDFVAVCPNRKPTFG